MQANDVSHETGHNILILSCACFTSPLSCQLSHKNHLRAAHELTSKPNPSTKINLTNTKDLCNKLHKNWHGIKRTQIQEITNLQLNKRQLFYHFQFFIFFIFWLKKDAKAHKMQKDNGTN